MIFLILSKLVSLFISLLLQNQSSLPSTIPDFAVDINQRLVIPLGQDTCANPIPGMNRIMVGVDVTKLDLRHDYSVDHIDGFTTTLLNITCKGGATWTSPFSNHTYDFPDQVLNVMTYSTGVKATEVLLHTNMESVRTSMSAEGGIDYKEGLFSASAGYKNSQSSLVNSSRFVATMRAFVSTTTIELIPPGNLFQSLNSYFLDALAGLPSNYEEHPEIYDSFIETYGTHYYASGYFGGSLASYFEVDKSYRQLTSDEEVKVNAAATFFGILKAHGAYDGNVSTVSEDFKKASHNSQRYFGGEANLFQKDGYTKWWPTVAGNPWLYGGKLRPLTDLIPNGNKRDALVRAVKVYISKAYLREVRGTGDSFMGRRLAGEDVVAPLLRKVEEMLNSVDVKDAEVSQVGREIEEYVVTPEWFTNVAYTVNWTNPYTPNSTLDIAKMFLPTPTRDVCPDYAEAPYCYSKDDVSFSNPPGAPAWWSSVKVLNTYAVDGKTNSWSFYIPFNSPGWLRNVEICFICDQIPICASDGKWTIWPDWAKFELHMKGAFNFVPHSAWA